MRLAVLAMVAALVAGCTATTSAPPLPAPAPVVASEARDPVTILVSIDGFRADYLDRGVTPTLSRLAAEGVTGIMRPSFPSITFPNHWTLVTGLRPDRSGIVGNKMEDPARPGETFTMASDDPFWWNESSPIWVDAEKAGIRTATMFWPGANVAVGGTLVPDSHGRVDGGTRPQDWQQFNAQVTGTQRVQAVLDWLRRPAAIRPRLVTLYFDTVDTAGHSYGPDDARTTAALADVDARIAMLVKGLAELGQPANLVIVADHGMAATSTDRLVTLDSIADPALFHVVEMGPYAALNATSGNQAALEARLLKPHDHLQCWRKADIPARLHYGRNPRVPAYLCLADVGWMVLDKKPSERKLGGMHGYDNMAPEMRALFVANGPAFARGKTIPAFDNVAIEPLLRDLIGLPPEAGLDGSDAPFRDVLTR